MIGHLRLRVRTPGRGFLDITPRVGSAVAELAPGADGLAHLFLRHTRAALVITENADPDVRADLELLARRWAPDGDPAYAHAFEGPDDMAAHGRSVLLGCELSVPVVGGRLPLGARQRIDLRARNTAPARAGVRAHPARPSLPARGGSGPHPCRPRNFTRWRPGCPASRWRPRA